jgi:hypothetical protein
MTGTKTAPKRRQDRSYDADGESAARREAVIKIGGKELHPRPKTGEVMEEFMTAAPEKPDNETETQEALRGIATIYAQLSVLLVDENDEPVDADWLKGELDIEDATELANKLMPQEEGRPQTSPPAAG